MSTEETNLGATRRTINLALGTREARKVRGPLLDNLYARPRQCGNLACAGKPVTEHRHVPGRRRAAVSRYRPAGGDPPSRDTRHRALGMARPPCGGSSWHLTEGTDQSEARARGDAGSFLYHLALPHTARLAAAGLLRGSAR